MVALEMAREFISHPVMKQVSYINHYAISHVKSREMFPFTHLPLSSAYADELRDLLS